MSEKQIIENFKKILAPGEVMWRAPKVKYQSTDIFGIFDVIVMDKLGKIYLIQLTTNHNRAARLNKMAAFFLENNITIPDNALLYAWDRTGFNIINLKKYVREN